MSMRRVLSLLLLAAVVPLAHAERLKDLGAVAGVRTNQLSGYGLVVGLDGTGDQTSQTEFTIQSFKSMLSRYGIPLPPGAKPQLKNVAAVMVQAELPPFAKPGQKIDVTVSSIGNAKSLRGGMLLMTPLKGVDGQVYAVAQGNLVVVGIGVSAQDGSSVTVNVPSSGRIPNGAIIERGVGSHFGMNNYLIFNLHSPDFTTAQRVASAINRKLGPDTARALDAVSIQIAAPRDSDQRVAYLSLLENMEIMPGEAPARVIVNARTGTVVIGSHVRVTPTAVSHGNIIVTISESPTVSQPPPFSGGETQTVQQSDIAVEAEDGRMFLFQPGTRLEEIVRAVNQVGAAAADLVAILEALKQAGALRAELIII